MTIGRDVQLLCDANGVPTSSVEAANAEKLFTFYLKKGYSRSYAFAKVGDELRKNSARSFEEWDRTKPKRRAKR